ncbi:GNAT family N-acetyltransferase [Thermorudis peleae]|uniref:GNAT family N-acetyltransferase n=1 Tax=Thermorudis peleae TaxID=1382356 RepID=UPI00057114C1|nr:GNAT family N-acetyltransferase [Thermorudis peleae]MBX6754423.1 GNAT family N-acetyltransferase [Thermorudis peleae]
MRCQVTGHDLQLWRYRWYGRLLVSDGVRNYALPMTGTIAQWFQPGEIVEFSRLSADKEEPLGFDNYMLARVSDDGLIPVWPVWQDEQQLVRTLPLSDQPLYTYRLRFREATRESDFLAIVDFEQHHYAAEEAEIARWYCPDDGRVVVANAQPFCPVCHRPMRFADLVDATRASRFLLAELLDREPYEPSVIGYVRVDPPLPIMHRRLPDGTIVRDIRRQIFPPDWISPTYWPVVVYRRLRKEHPDRPARELWAMAEAEALAQCNTRGARIARVVVHPDYRGDGLGVRLVQAALRWIHDRRIPEMRQAKDIVETVALMARYNPFFERVGFRYLWDTASGRPVLYYALTPDAQTRIDHFLAHDEVGQQHRGQLYRARLDPVEPLAGSIVIDHVTKFYRTTLSLRALPMSLQQLLRAFGVARRTMTKTVFRRLSLEIPPRAIVALVGASGSGKTTLLRMIAQAAGEPFGSVAQPDTGRVLVPENVQVAVFFPGEREPLFEGVTLLEAVWRLTNDEVAALELLNAVGLGDALLFRATPGQLSTGQRERARLALLFASRANLILIDEFAAHLDPSLARRVARKLSELARRLAVTVIVATHRPEVVEALAPDHTLVVGYGGVRPLT